MATTGVAHHRSKTFFDADHNYIERAARAARFAARDAAYRAALGLPERGGELPAVLGIAVGHGAGKREAMMAGGRMTRRAPAAL